MSEASKVLPPRREKIVHLGEVHPDQVLEHVDVGASPRAFTVGGVSYVVKISGTRLRAFKRSRICAVCGLVGTKMMLDLPVDTEVPHFNLYGEEDGQLVLMTQDHVKPRSLGGASWDGNLRTACHTCNNVRGNDTSLTDDDIRRLRTGRGRAPSRGGEQSVSVQAALPYVTEAADEQSQTAMAWALVRYAYAITSALALGDAARAFDAAEKAQRLLGKLLGKLRLSSLAA